MRVMTMAALGVAAYATFLVALMPASHVASKIQEMSQGGLQVREAGGTIWNGSGRATVATPAGPLAIESVRWRFLPSRLASGRLGFAVEGSSSGFIAKGEFGRSFAAWEARDVAVNGRASGVASFLPLLAHWRPEGTLSAAAPLLTWDDRDLRGDARLEWRGAAVSTSDVRPLGSWRAELRGEGGPAKVSVTTVEGPLRISGRGTFTPGSRLAFSGDARAEGPAAADLQPLLDLLGPPRADGSRALEWRLTWSQSAVERNP